MKHLALFFFALTLHQAFSALQKCHTTSQQQLTPNMLSIKAKYLTYEATGNTYTAKERVHVTQPLTLTTHRELFADSITYNKHNNTVKAIGHVILKDATGTISYADSLEITDTLKDGIIESLRMITKNDERILSSKATRKDGITTQFYNASYTPCKVCTDENGFWQLNASEVEHDKHAQTIYYYNVTLTLGNIPIFYAPYFSHPDPTVKRKSGLLFPSFGSGSETGLYISQPYYYVIDNTSDVTLTPTFMSKENPSTVLQYRKNFMDGALEISGSYHRQKKKTPYSAPETPMNQPGKITQNRWHLFSNLDYEIDANERFKLKINRASDTTYLSLYPFSERSYSNTFRANRNLTSNISYENFNDNTYSSVKGAAYQTDRPKTTPIVLPHADHHFFSKDTVLGGFYTLNTSFIGLKREWGVPGIYAKDTGRFSIKGAWERLFLQDDGHLFGINLKLRQDLYYTKGFNKHQSVSETSPQLYALQRNNQKTTGRFYPQLVLDWRYPLAHYNESWSYVVEPKAMVAVASESSGSRFVPNNDSRTFTLDDTTLFRANRFDGLDRVDSGRRVVYGIDQKIYWGPDSAVPLKSASWFIGQSRRLDNHQALENTAMGENKKYSDLVNRFKVQPIDDVHLRVRNAIDVKTRKQRFMEIGALIGKPMAQIDIGYVKLASNSNIYKTRLSQLNWQFSSKINDQWSVSYAEIRNFLHSTQGPLNQYAAIAWENECFKFETGLFKSRIQINDVKPSTGFLFQLTFKNLGNFSASSAPRYPSSILSQF